MGLAKRSVILIVEDDQCIRDLCRMILKSSGKPIDVLEASNIMEAETIIRNNEPIDFAILDGNVPGGRTTTELAKDIRQQNPHCFMIAASCDECKRTELINVGGCNQAVCKDEVPYFIIEMIKKNSP